MKLRSSLLRAICEGRRKTVCLLAVTRDTVTGSASALAIVRLKRLIGNLAGLQPNESGGKIISPGAEDLIDPRWF